MTLIIEDGSVVAGADSYESLADARVDAANRGLSISDDDTIAESQLRQAYYWIANQYENQFQGYRISQLQTGSLPRGGMVAYGFSVASNSIPKEFILAQTNIAASVNDGADLNAIKTDADLSGFNVSGVYSETYQSGSSTPTLPYMPAVSSWLRPFTKQATDDGGVYRQSMGYIP